MKKLIERIESRLKAVGKTAQAASIEAGLSKDAIRNIRRAAKSDTRVGVSSRTIEKLAPVLKTSVGWLLTGRENPPDFDDVNDSSPKSYGLINAAISGHIPVTGEISAGVWRDYTAMSDTGESIPLIPHPRFPESDQRVMRVKGDSCDLVAPDGSYVNTVPIGAMLPPDGIAGLVREFASRGKELIVVMEASRGDMVEMTMKALVQKGDALALESRSSNPRWEQSSPYSDDMLEDHSDLRLTRVMIGKYEAMI